MAGIFPDGGVPAGQALGADPTIGAEDTVNCEDGALFHPTNRCPPRFDPKAANTVISELINLVLCSGNKYDCSQYDNLCEAVRKMINDALFDCLPQQFPAAANACSIEQLVLMRGADGCERIGRYSTGAAQISAVTNSSVWGLNYGPAIHPLPGQRTVGTHIYEITQLRADRQANTVNQTVLYGPGNQNWLAEMSVTVPCDTLVELDYAQIVDFDPGANGGNGQASVCVIEMDGQLILLQSGLVHFGEMTNFVNRYTSTARITVPAGTHTLRFFLVSVGGSPAEVQVYGHPTDSSASWIARTAVN